MFGRGDLELFRRLDFHVRCSKGTYVRTLVEDVAKAAGTVGHVASLRRLVVDPFDFQVQGMQTFEALDAAARDGLEALDRLLLPADAALPSWPAAELEPAAVAQLARGQAVAAQPAWPCGPVKVYAAAGQFIAIGVVTADRRLAPTRVFIR